MTRSSIPAGLGALALVAVAVPAGVSFAGTERPAAESRPATTQADSAAAETPKVPPALAPPPGHVVHAVLKARGVQVYGCQSGAWALIEPAASLTGVTVRPVKRTTALHFRGPSWQSDQDGSLVEGNREGVLQVPSDNPDSIPQLRIAAKTTRGDGVFGKVTYIQRLDTVGGVAPRKACTGSATTAVPYRAVYRFFVAKG
ncbi:DUF3455 domain-containing protein [Actinoplanes sp. NBC_00393]|uniref:DUF3455 domain-containing protein n=1 Tax=Actinoplanes sp. NBC_00393 TaxID=2975953 RepID=UPI002E201310